MLMVAIVEWYFHLLNNKSSVFTKFAVKFTNFVMIKLSFPVSEKKGTGLVRIERKYPVF
ncbi:hypothetical protein HanRHA438_Chr04g0167911 [Helianthus annuus]|nr:hypothetical protein HanRHA438_Chr04g0167911 [Helianthus annuus]